MGALVLWVAKYGGATVLAAALLYILLRGELTFRYPRDSRSKRS